MYDLVISNGTIVTAERTQQADLGITDGCIAAIATGGELGPSKRQVNADGLHVLPGLVDAHVHLREPGGSHKETFRTGTMAAAAGGVTSLAAIPNTNPLLDRKKPFADAIALGRESAVVDFAIFAGLRFGDPAEIDELAAVGAIGFDICDDPFAVAAARWTEIFAMLGKHGLPLGFYLLDSALQAAARARIEASGGSQIEQYLSFMTPELELAAAARAVAYGAQYEVPIILRTVTTAATLAHVRLLRRGASAPAFNVEMAPHYLFLTTDDLKSQMTAAQMLPPLRGKDELPALWQGVADGTVDYLGSESRAPCGAGKSRRGFVRLTTRDRRAGNHTAVDAHRGKRRSAIAQRCRALVLLRTRANVGYLSTQGRSRSRRGCGSGAGGYRGTLDL